MNVFCSIDRVVIEDSSLTPKVNDMYTCLKCVKSGLKTSSSSFNLSMI